ncbi:DUF6602 domain-containing protein [Cystobacter fuscus]
MPTISRQAIFEQAARKLRQEFQELMGTVPHSGLKGSEAERLIRRFLNDHLPKRFHAGSGIIIDKFDNISRQTDVIVYDALNCPVYRASDEAAIIPNDNVAAIIEVKSRLDRTRLEEAAVNIAAAKKLAKAQAPDLPIFSLSSTFGCVFAFESATSLEALAESLREMMLSSTPLGEHIDLVVVLDKGLFGLHAKPRGQERWAPALFDGLGGANVEGTHLGLGVHPFGDKTLDGFLRLLLAHLTYFRGLVAQPGFQWSSLGGEKHFTLIHLAAITLEQDPVVRQQKLEQYLKELAAEMVPD